jgi:pimeloyl-ACP methyl ester carboxylesterase
MVPPEGIVVVGASNGTTSALDFAVTTEGPKPRALVFLSPGQYTEAQYTIADQRAALEPIPILFAYPGAEAAYSNAIAAAAPATWQFIEYAEGSHGTGLLQTPRVVEDIVGFLAQ